MSFIVTEPCIGCKNAECVEVCPVDCIYGTRDNSDQAYIHPSECIDCGKCVPACPVQAIYQEIEVPRAWESFIAKNYNHFGLEAPSF